MTHEELERAVEIIQEIEELERCIGQMDRVRIDDGILTFRDVAGVRREVDMDMVPPEMVAKFRDDVVAWAHSSIEDLRNEMAEL